MLELVYKQKTLTSAAPKIEYASLLINSINFFIEYLNVDRSWQLYGSYML